MKKLNILLILLIGGVASVLSSCTKSSEDNFNWNWTHPIAIGTKFTYYNLAKLNPEIIPTNPFIVDSVAIKAYDPYNGYYVHSNNGQVFVLDPMVIRAGISK